MNYQEKVLIIYIIFSVFMSLISFILFNVDKRKAIKNDERIKEKTLLSSVVFCGAIGGFLGRIICRHKLNKSYFSFTIYFSLICQAIVIACLIMF